MRIFLPIIFALLLSGCAGDLPEPSLMLIAHRGGVVDARRSENSIKALEEAIRRGYTHVEVDARVTADGHVVCFHEDELMEEAGIPGRISELPLDSVIGVMLPRSNEPIPTFEEYVARCAGRIGIMVDLKGCPADHIEQYAGEIETALAKYNMLEEALILINKTPVNNQDRIVSLFLGKSRISWRQSLMDTQLAIARDSAFAQYYYVFNHGADFDLSAVRGFQELGLDVIVSINTGHYKTGDQRKQGEQHVREMLKLGVDGLQIDSVYDPLILQ